MKMVIMAVLVKAEVVTVMVIIYVVVMLGVVIYLPIARASINDCNLMAMPFCCPSFYTLNRLIFPFKGTHDACLKFAKRFRRKNKVIGLASGEKQISSKISLKDLLSCFKSTFFLLIPTFDCSEDNNT